MRKLIAAASVAAVAATLALSTPAQAACTPGPSGQPSDTFYLHNPATDGKQYVNVDGGSGRIHAGSSNQPESAYFEVVVVVGTAPEAHFYNRNEGIDSDYRASVTSAGFSECGQLGSV